jgi:hypothetical protein
MSGPDERHATDTQDVDPPQGMSAGRRCAHSKISAVRDSLPRDSLMGDSVSPGTQNTSELQQPNCVPEQNQANRCNTF